MIKPLKSAIPNGDSPRNITTRVASTFLLLSLLTVGIVGGVAFLRARDALKQAAFNRLNVAATLKEEEITRWFEDQQRDFFLITQFPDIQSNLKVLINPPSPETRQSAEIALGNYLQGVVRIKPNLSEIFVLDRTNRIVVSSNLARKGQYTNLASVTYLKEVASGDRFAPIFYVSLTSGKPTVTFAAPLNDQTGKRQGAILATLNLNQVDQIVRERTGLGESGESYMVGSLVNEFSFISKESTPGQQFKGGVSSRGIDTAMQGLSGSGLYQNYAQVPVIGVYRWLNDQDIALLVEMQQEEAFAPARQLAGTIILVGLVSVAGLAVGVRWLARQLQESREQLERYSQQLEQKAEEANAANRAKSEFLANMSHELRTPLNAILGFTQLMTRDTSINAVQRDQLNIINRSGEHLLTLINDVLEMSKIEAGQVALNEDSFNLGQLLITLEEMFQLKARSKKLNLRFECAPNVPQHIKTDEGKLRQVLMNLIGNAIKFTETGYVAVRVRRAPNPVSLDPPIDTLLFEIEDSGPGIANHEIKYLFEPFAQTETGRTSRQGTGLGLPISQKFVQWMGGDIRVSSVPGRGSLFAFTTPVQLVDAAEVVEVRSLPPVVALAPNQPKYRLLIVEDRWENRQLLLNLLVPMGFELQEAENGKEAIALWQTWHPHLIWMDMRMPIMDGYEATRQIRTQEAAQKLTTPTKIIALTASAFEEARSVILAAGCDDFVRKPFQVHQIFEKLAEHLGVQYVYGEPTVAEPVAAPQDAVAAEPITLDTMPSNWIEELRQAATKVNAKQVLQLVQQIPPEHAELAQTLTQLVDRFQFEDIVMLTQTAK
ncbi:MULTISPECIES: hybrid sensor histidine kinase/response regulator [unclassified Leptolyngbya]|uniref:hybrid sensor histidine kinase/response regulator n=1 Tax=unclassified Leptolyngbya TaxID=2650499 RepID=UPI001687C47A|nr:MULTISPECIES: hybrid sensor histidine kinase/response regulator [unclassified Leptolyngbya]MBD1913366.1 response regulator [Leptolyngbya sp. FACHB-8]MBD2158703.1 response regulator [Leptolyngbya sp. FACHB-16]